MKKYHIADVLTASRFVCALVLMFFVIYNANPGWVLLVFVIGELTDAFDGIAARRWQYPSWLYGSWFHRHAVVLDQVADLALGVMVLLYVTLRINLGLGLAILILAVAIGVPIQIWRNAVLRKHGKLDQGTLKFVLARRGFYVIAIYVIMLVLLWDMRTFGGVLQLNASMAFWLKLFLTMLSLAIGLLLVALKRDRLTEDKTPMPPRRPDGRQVRRKVPKEDVPPLSFSDRS